MIRPTLTKLLGFKVDEKISLCQQVFGISSCNNASVNSKRQHPSLECIKLAYTEFLSDSSIAQ